MFSIEGFTTGLEDRLTKLEHEQLGDVYSFQAKAVFFPGPDRALYEGWMIRVEFDGSIKKIGETLSIRLGEDTYTFCPINILQVDKTYVLLYAPQLQVNSLCRT